MRASRSRLLSITPRRVGLVLCLFCFIWALTVMNLSLVSRQEDVSSPDELRVSTVIIITVTNTFGIYAE